MTCNTGVAGELPSREQIPVGASGERQLRPAVAGVTLLSEGDNE
jgi:hypothetical protein